MSGTKSFSDFDLPGKARRVLHLVRDLAQHGDLGRGISDVTVARAQPARSHLEHFAKGYRPTERLPLE
jgi:hypothetical protein